MKRIAPRAAVAAIVAVVAAAVMTEAGGSEEGRREALLKCASRHYDCPVATPLMGWSSWNTFAVNISDKLIVETAEAMATNGLKAAGYMYVNIDDGFFAGHEPGGHVGINKERFPGGLKPVADRIHELGMFAGIYSDAGSNTCGSAYNTDTGGINAGLYGYDKEDCDYFFRECGFDFIKVDYCGGGWLKLDERKRYTEISAAIRAASDGKARFNICRWKFPGTWAADIAESWRTTRDIRANWKIVRDIITENLYLSAFVSPGHYNDLDMLEVGQHVGKVKSEFHDDTGLTPDEELTHFGMWCMLSSPLLIGCDVRSLEPETMKLVTNPYMIGMNQNNGLGLQGYIVRREGQAYVLVKDAYERYGLARYVALYNSGDEPVSITLDPADIDLAGDIAAFDLIDQADIGAISGPTVFQLAPHASRFLLVDGTKRLERVRYEAETAYLPLYQKLHDAYNAGTPDHETRNGASGGVVVANLGKTNANYLEWRDVNILEAGERALKLRVSSLGPSTFFLQIDSGAPVELRASGAQAFEELSTSATLDAGTHTVKIFCNDGQGCPDVDVLTICRE